MAKRAIITAAVAFTTLLTSTVTVTAGKTEIPTLLDAPNFMNTELVDPTAEFKAARDHATMQLVTDLIDEANNHLGTRYHRGGKKPGGFDCSGFTSYIFRQFGINLSASSGGQFTQGTEVDTDDIRPGDLLFFKGSRSRSVGHVAIAIENNHDTGEITFIHAAVKGGIRIDRVSQPYYRTRYLGARRVLN